MIFIYQYDTEEEREQLMNANSDKRLIEQRNITEGNFLIFTDQLSEQSLQEQLRELQTVVADLISLLLENEVI